MTTPTLQELQTEAVNHAVERAAGELTLHIYELDDKGNFVARYDYLRAANGYCYDLGKKPPYRIKREAFDALYACCRYRVTPGKDGEEVIIKIPQDKADSQFYMPYCPYCGQGIIPAEELPTAEAAEYYAKRNCKCGKAKDFQDAEERKERRERNLEKIKLAIADFNDYANQRQTELTDEVKTILYNNAVAVLDGIIGNAKISFCTLKAAIDFDNNSNVVFTFSYSDKVKRSVQ